MPVSIAQKVGGMLAVLVGLHLSGAVATPVDAGPVRIEAHDSGLAPDWPRRAVFMEILVRAYQDSNGDGVGDIPGLIQRLDYLKSLGINALWLLPVYPSADHDHGYAVTNYRDIDPEFGALADFDRLLKEAHRRGIAIILDYVINHSADSHPLFQSANADPSSPWRDWYVWSDNKPEGWTTYGGDPWHAGRSGFYYGAFSPQMPDFNFRNPAVLDFHLNNLKFWLNRGVDGFRFDAVGALVENGPLAWENQPENHLIMTRIHALLDQYGKRYMIAEAPSAPTEFSAVGSAGSAFAFGLQSQIVKSAQFGRVLPGLLDDLERYSLARMGTFLANHDSFAGSRLYHQFDGEDSAYKMAAATLLTLPGIPFIYYGEEVGQSVSEPVVFEDQRLRGPMSWNRDGSGFSSTKPFRPPAVNVASQNAADEENDPHSLLNTYRALIHLRRQQPVLATGALTLLSGDDDPALVFLREEGRERLWVAINYARTATTLRPPSGTWQAVYPFPSDHPREAGEIVLPAQQALVLKQTGP